ncbi:hypothetical protein AAC387_Pa10g0938 [Persea americana]
MNNPIVINECSYLSGCARTSQRKVTAYSAFSVLYRDQEWLGRAGHCAELALTPSRRADPSCWHSQPSCQAAWWRSLESAYLTEPPNYWAMITRLRWTASTPTAILP